MSMRDKGYAMKAQKNIATKTQMYFQQKRKCKINKINKTATCNFKSATFSSLR